MVTIHFVWYWFVLGSLAFGAATVQLIRYTAHSARFDVLSALLYVAAVLLLGASVTRDVPFLIVFSISFGMFLAVVNWLSLRNRSKLPGSSGKRSN
jgi:hypothetical protein